MPAGMIGGGGSHVGLGPDLRQMGGACPAICKWAKCHPSRLPCREVAPIMPHPLRILGCLFLSIAAPQIAQASQGLERIPPAYSVVEGTELLVQNMPRVRNQGAMGICYAFTVQALIDHARCTIQKIENCSTAEPLSPLDISRFSLELGPDVDQTDRFNYEGLKPDAGGALAFTLLNTLKTGSIILDKCAPYENMLINSDSFEQVLLAHQQFLKEINTLYKSVRKGEKSIPEAAQTLDADSRILATHSDIKDALEQETYDLFLDRLLIPSKCWEYKNASSLPGSLDIDIWPKEDSNIKTLSGPQKYEHGLALIKDLLKKNTPVGVAYCGEPSLKAKSMKSCGNFGHTVVITGYRRTCSAKECRDSFKVHNSWGEAWQRDNDDGWINARTLLDRSFYADHMLTWLKQEE